MLLTLKQPAHHGYTSFHDYSPPTPPSTSRFSPALTSAGPSFPPLSAASNTASRLMSTPHRGLPPPAAMAQGAPPPLGQPMPLSQPMGQLPAPPQQWQGAEESMRNWLHAKTEEDKRKQEEEKTRQEALRLEQRKIEQDMLRTSLTGGIPPYMIPMVFAGMGGGNLPNASLEWAQHYMSQAHHLQQQQQQPQSQQPLLPPQTHPSPELRRESRQITQVYNTTQHPIPASVPSTPIGPGASQQGGGFLPSYPPSPLRSRAHLPGPAALARPPPTSQLPSLNQGEMQIQAPPQGPTSMQIVPGQPTHPLHQSQSVQASQQEAQSPQAPYFWHHWVPPKDQAGGNGSNQPTTPSEVHSSPKKRKAQGPQQAAPPPTSQPNYTSPSFSHAGSSASGTPATRRRAHSRQRSDLSSRGTENYSRTMSRHRYTESGISTQSGTSPTNNMHSFESGAASAASDRGPHSRRDSSQHANTISNDTRQLPQTHEGRFSTGPPETRHEDQGRRHSAEEVASSSSRGPARQSR